MAHIYIALVDTPGILAFLIRSFLKQKYIHVVLSMDPQLKEAYSVGRRIPWIPLLSGFEREDREEILQAFPTAQYQIYELECSVKQKEQIRRMLENDWENRFRIHYAVLGLFFILLGRPFYQQNHYTCSSYVARLLGKNGIRISEKHFSLVTPKDFYEYAGSGKRIIFEGRLAELAAVKKKSRMKGLPQIGGAV